MRVESVISPLVPRHGRSCTVRFARAAAAMAALALAGCGSDDVTDEGATTRGSTAARPTLTVQAAASLTGALTSCTKDYAPAEVRLSFAGSDELAAQIRKGAGGDLFAAANATLPRELAKEGVVRAPREFAGNELVLAAPARDAKVDALRDLVDDDGLRLAVGAPSVPVGSYTQEALARLPGAQRDAILDRVATEEPDVKSVLAKLGQGVVDAAFVYRTDVRATKGAVTAIALPAEIRPKVSYEAAVVAGTKQPVAAEAFLADLVSGRCGDALRAAGFLAPGAAG